MADPRDRVEIQGVEVSSHAMASDAENPSTDGLIRPWLGVWFKCCHVYGRMYRDASGSRYDGACPRCGARVGAQVGSGGTSRRIFEAE